MRNGPTRDILARLPEITKDPIRRYYNRLRMGGQNPLETPAEDPRRLLVRQVSRTGDLPDVLSEEEKNSLLSEAGQGDAENRNTDVVIWSYGGVSDTGIPNPLTEESANAWTNASPTSLANSWNPSSVWWEASTFSMPWSPLRIEYNFKDDFIRLAGFQPLAGDGLSVEAQILANRELLEGITVAENEDLIVSILQSIFDPINNGANWTPETRPQPTYLDLSNVARENLSPFRRGDIPRARDFESFKTKMLEQTIPAIQGQRPAGNLQNLFEISLVLSFMDEESESLQPGVFGWAVLAGRVLARTYGDLDPADLWNEVTAALNNAELLDEDVAPPIGTYEYLSFRESSHYVLDYETSVHFNNSPNIEDTSNELASINPEYVFYNEVYERAISSSQVPEAVLPNMYIYSFVTDNPARTPGFGARVWQRSMSEASEVNSTYDRLITLGEIIDPPRHQFGIERIQEDDLGIFGEGGSQFFSDYANAVSPQGDGDLDRGVTFEFMSELSQQYYNLQTPSSEMNIYKRFNSRKNQFPMYIETSFPAQMPGSIGSIIEDTNTSTAFINSFVIGNFENKRYMLETSGYQLNDVGDGGLGPQTSEQQAYNRWTRDGTYRDQGREVPVDHELRTINVGGNENFNTNPLLRVFGFNEWFDNALERIEDQEVLGQEGRERFSRQCPTLLDRVNIQAVRDRVRLLERSNFLTYKDILDGDSYSSPQFSPSETIIYRLIKYAVSPTNEETQIIQNFYFPTSKLVDVVKFVDTQVKYNKKYRYELHGITVVFGTKISMTPIKSNISGEEDEPLYGVFKVVSEPHTKIIEYPIYNKIWERYTTFGVQNEDQQINFGVSYPDTWVYDRPPSPPEIFVAPYQNNIRQVLINLRPSGESFLGHRALPRDIFDVNRPEYTDASRRLAAATKKSIVHQKLFENFELGGPNMEFKNESSAEVKRMEIFRSDTPPEPANLFTAGNTYYSRNFRGKLHKVLDISQDINIPTEERALSFATTDDLEPNKVYYYTARAIDVHHKPSNFSAVYEVELVYDKGAYYPRVELYTPKEIDTRTPTKKMAKYIQIRAAKIQSDVRNTVDQANNIINSSKGFIDDDALKTTNNKKFLIRLTSKDTGRKIQFKLDFKSEETSDDT